MSKIIEHYDSYYTGNDNLRRWRDEGAIYKAQNVRDRWAAIDKSSSPHQLLDIGCGDGAVLAALEGFSDEAVGVDVSSSGVDAARGRQIPRTTFEVNEGPIPYPDGSYDLAILSHVVEHLEDPRTVLREAARVAEFVFVEVPLELNARTPRHFQWTDVGHINLYNPLLIRHLVESCGLKVLDEAVTLPGYRSARFYGYRGILAWAIKSAMAKLLPMLATRLFTYHGSLIACASEPEPDGLEDSR